MERMRTLSVKYPVGIASVVNLSPESFEEEAKMAMAVKLFEIGRLTSGQAASLAGIPRAMFLLNCGRFGANSVEWTDPQELEHEFTEKL